MSAEITKEILEKVYKPRDPDAQKYDFGHLLIIGGEMGREAKTFEFINEFLKIVGVPVVIDADAIYAVAKALPGTVPGNPHVGVFRCYRFMIRSVKL